MTWADFWGSPPAGETRIEVHVTGATPVAYNSVGHLSPGDGPTISSGTALDDDSDATYARWTRFSYAGGGGTARTRAPLPAVTVDPAATEVLIQAALRWRTNQTSAAGWVLMVIDSSLPPDHSFNPTSDVPITEFQMNGFSGGETPDVWVSMTTTAPALSPGQITKLAAGGYVLDIAPTSVPTSPSSPFQRDLAEVWLMVSYTTTTPVEPVVRTPLRARQRASGVTGAIPLCGRNNAAEGLRGRQNANA